MANGLSQTLYLLKDQGTVQLKFASTPRLVAGNNILQPASITTWIGRQVTGFRMAAGGPEDSYGWMCLPYR